MRSDYNYILQNEFIIRDPKKCVVHRFSRISPGILRRPCSVPCRVRRILRRPCSVPCRVRRFSWFVARGAGGAGYRIQKYVWTPKASCNVPIVFKPKNAILGNRNTGPKDLTKSRRKNSKIAKFWNRNPKSRKRSCKIQFWRWLQRYAAWPFQRSNWVRCKATSGMPEMVLQRTDLPKSRSQGTLQGHLRYTWGGPRAYTAKVDRKHH